MEKNGGKKPANGGESHTSCEEKSLHRSDKEMTAEKTGGKIASVFVERAMIRQERLL